VVCTTFKQRPLVLAHDLKHANRRRKLVTWSIYAGRAEVILLLAPVNVVFID